MDAYGGGDQLQANGKVLKFAFPHDFPQLIAWVNMGDEFSLDINNPDDPKMLVGNNSTVRISMQVRLLWFV